MRKARWLTTFSFTPFPKSLKMKKCYSLLSLLIVIMSLTACGPDKNRVRFEGELSNINNAEFYVYSESGAFEGVDTIKIEDGRFSYERQIDEPVLLTLLYPNYSQNYVIAEPGKVIKMKGDAAKIGEAEITGTEENELLTDFRLATNDSPERDRQMAATRFIRANAKTLAAVAVFSRYFSAKQKPDAREALSMLDELKQAQPARAEVKYIDEFFRPIFLNGEGVHIPAFEVVTVDGKTINSKDLAGKPFMIVTLASWQPDSYTFIRNLHRTARDRSPQTKIIIIGMDVERDALTETLKRDSISYPVICERRSFESPVATRLGLRYVPSCMLVDSKGVIVQRDVEKVEDVKWSSLK